MSKVFSFGEKVKSYKIKVLNEREVRAGAGILFFLAMFSFMIALLKGNFYFTKIFVIIFLVDFFIRLFINPKFSPSLMLGRFFVQNQTPEYVGAAPKRFAWGIGFSLALIMLVMIVILNAFSPLNVLICITCLFLLFFESAFGVCLGCLVYHKFNKKVELCAGDVCEVKKKEEIQKISSQQVIVLAVFLIGLFVLMFSGIISGHYGLMKQYQKNIQQKTSEQRASTPQSNNDLPSKDKDLKLFEVNGLEKGESCIPPDWAVKIGHGEIWKEHHGCE